MTRLVYIGGFGQSGSTLLESLRDRKSASGCLRRDRQRLRGTDRPRTQMQLRRAGKGLPGLGRLRARVQRLVELRRFGADAARTRERQICDPVRLLQNRMGFDHRAVPASTPARATVLPAAPGEGPASRMLVGDTPASHQDAPEAKADADRASSVAADPPALSHRGGVVGRQSRLRVVLAGSTLVDICASPTRMSHPPRARRSARCSRPSPPICPCGLKSPRRAATGIRSTATECAVSDCDLPTCGLTGAGNPKWRPATAGWPPSSHGRCG